MGLTSLFPAGGITSTPKAFILASVAAGVSLLLVLSPLLPKIKKIFKRRSLLQKLEAARFTKVGNVSSLNVYPIKSAKGDALQHRDRMNLLTARSQFAQPFVYFYD